VGAKTKAHHYSHRRRLAVYTDYEQDSIACMQCSLTVGHKSNKMNQTSRVQLPRYDIKSKLRCSLTRSSAVAQKMRAGFFLRLYNSAICSHRWRNKL